MSFLDSEDLRIISNGCQSQPCPSPCYPPCPDKSCAQSLPNCSTRDNYMFMSTISPVNNLMGSYTQCANAAQFLIRRKNRVVTLQWEPFTGTINVNGATFLEVQQTIQNLPPYPMQFPIFCTYLDQFRTVVLEIVPTPSSCYKGGNIHFYLNTDKSNTGIHMNDTFSFPASAVSWIVES